MLGSYYWDPILGSYAGILCGLGADPAPQIGLDGFCRIKHQVVLLPRGGELGRQRQPADIEANG